MRFHVDDKSRITAMRTSFGLSQVAAAESIGYKPRQWQKWESGKSQMPISELLLFTLLHTSKKITPADLEKLACAQENPEYESLIHHVLEHGIDKQDRTGVGTRSIFGHQMRFDLSQGFPLVTTKKIHIKSVIYELLWFLRGDGNVKFLQDNGVTIWDEWADPETGDLGRVYGVQWRSWATPSGEGIDQISQVIHTLKTNPDSRRMIVSSWNVADVDKMALPPCHVMFQFYVTPATNGGKPKLSCQLYQRSADIFLGVPFNIASYALLTHMVAQQCDMDVGEFIWTGGDCHLYNNHFDQARLQLSRKPFDLPRLNMKRKPESIFDYCFEDFEFVGYEHHPAIKASVAV